MIFKTGDHITIAADSRIVPGIVLFASENGHSLMLQFEAILCGHAGMMPVLQEPDGGFVSLFGDPVAISRA